MGRVHVNILAPLFSCTFYLFSLKVVSLELLGLVCTINSEIHTKIPKELFNLKSQRRLTVVDVNIRIQCK